MRSKPLLPDQRDLARKPAEAWSEEDHNVLHHFAAPAPTATAGKMIFIYVYEYVDIPIYTC